MHREGDKADSHEGEDDEKYLSIHNFAAKISKIRDGWLQGQRLSIVSAIDFSALGEYEMVYPNLNTRRLVREGILFLLKFVFYFISPSPSVHP